MLVCLVFLMVGLTIIYLICGNARKWSLVGAVSCLVLIFVIIMFYRSKVTINTGKYRYKVIFRENMNLDELTDKYDIVNKDGKIYELEDK